MLTHDLITNSCCDNLVDMEPSYRGKSSLNKNLFNQKESGYSSHSIIQCMENFVDAVHEMDDTILVPSRLMDLKVDGNKPDCKSSLLAALLTSLPDLFTLYTMVRNLKNQLQWGTKDQRSTDGPEDGMTTPSHYNATTNTTAYLTTPLLSTKGHIRRPSTASMSSTNSSTASVISEPDSEASIENDSGIDAELDACTKMSSLEIVEQNFQRHLRGLGDTLNQLTEAAHYVTKRYQKDVLGVIE